METTSSGLELHRVWGVEYDLAVVTNITSEHLEVHGTLENYRRAKAMLFEAVDPTREEARSRQTQTIPRYCVLNADDSSFQYLRPFCRAPILSYGITNPADIRAEDLILDPPAHDSRCGRRVASVFPSRPPWWGASTSRTAWPLSPSATCTGYRFLVMASALAGFAGVPGRMERIDAGQQFAVIVDYAHTAESLARVLEVLRPVTRGG